MKRTVMAIFIVSIIFVLSLPLAAVAKDGVGYDVGVEYDLGAGYRTDDFDWNIASDITGTQTPNILSELTWSDLNIFQVEVGVKAHVERVYARGSLDYGWILDGDNQDSDYLGDNRTLEFSRSNNDAGDGNVLDASVGIGYKIIDNKLMVAPLVGYSYHNQDLRIQNGFQTIPPLGPFPGLNSSYDAEWDGPWVGVDASVTASERLDLFASFEYHWADYEAEANWNLRADFAHPVSFRHEADGKGIIISAGAGYSPGEHWSVRASGKYMDWETDPGIDRVFFSDGSQAQTRLNEVNWESLAFMLEAAYSF